MEGRFAFADSAYHGASHIHQRDSNQPECCCWLNNCVFALSKVDHGYGHGAAEKGAAGVAHKDLGFREGSDSEIKQQEDGYRRGHIGEQGDLVVWRLAIGQQQQAEQRDNRQRAGQAIYAVDHIVGITESGDRHRGKGNRQES